MDRATRTRSRRTSLARPRARAALTCLFLGAATISVPFFTPAIAQVFAFQTVRVEGNVRVDASTILNFAGIARGQEVSAGALNDAYQRIVASGLFESVEVLPQGSELVIRVSEYPFINIINFEGNKRLKDEELAGLVQSQSRRVYSPAAAEADAATIAEAYRVRGRMAATVTPKIIRRSDNRVDLVFEITEGRVVEIERLSFAGNRAFSDRRLRQVLETKQAGFLRQLIQRDTFVAERLELDKQLLTDFYLSRGYVDFEVLDATAEVARERDATFVTFTVREGLSYTIGTVTTVSEIDGLDSADFEAVQKIRTGQTYNPAIIENNIARMETLALRKGANFVRVEPRITRDDRNQAIDIEFALVRGERIFVERIDIEGNATTIDEVVRRQFRTVEGDPFNPREIRQSAERIRALGFFADAQVEAEPGSGGDQVVVNVDVEEQPTGTLSFGLSYGVASGVGAAISFSETNFLGRGQALSASLTTGVSNRNLSFRFTEPALLGRDLRFSIGAYFRTSEQEDADYDTSNAGFSLGIGFPLGEQSRIDLDYRLSSDRLFNVDIGDPLAVPPTNGSSEIIQREALLGRDGALVTSSIAYTYEFDNRITGLNPTTGYVLRFGQEFGGLGGDTKFIETTVFALAQTRILNEEVTLRAIFEGGNISTLGGGSSRVTDRFFGRGKIRGFEPNGIGPRDLGASNQDALGGNNFVVARFEADFPIGLPEEYGITGGAFVDIGSVWSLDDTAGTGGAVDDSFQPRVSVGLSFLWETPIGPLRFNFSKALEKQDYDKEQSFDLTIATQF